MKIILACDPATSPEELLQHVKARAWGPATTFRVLAAVDQIPADYFMDAVPDVMAHAGVRAVKHAESQAETMLAALRTGGLQGTFVVIDGDPHHAIVEEAGRIGADLILLGAPRREEGFPSLNNRVARAVIRHAPCSVQIMRTGVVRRVLIPTDGSVYSIAVAHSIAARKWHEGTVFQVMSVMEPISAAASFLYPPHGLLADDSEEAESLREHAMQKVLSAIQETERILIAAGLAVTDHVLLNVESPGKLIMNEATTWGADLIVMGSHGRRGLKRFLIGSVSESVAMHAACSVEIVR